MVGSKVELQLKTKNHHKVLVVGESRRDKVLVVGESGRDIDLYVWSIQVKFKVGGFEIAWNCHYFVLVVGFGFG